MSPLRFCLCFLLSAAAAGADYFDDTGFRALASAVGPALPDGAGLGVTQVEFGIPGYLPEAGNGTFTGTTGLMAGKTFSAKSGASSVSGHAVAVGAHFYGNNTTPDMGRAGFTPGIALIDLYIVDAAGSEASWLEAAFLTPGLLLPPRPEPNVAQNHSWISDGSSATASIENDLLQRFDFAIVRDGFLAVTGVNNRASAVPALMASAYNNLAVGVSSGHHSTGGVPPWLDGPGRQKPEIVAPLDFTSFSTPLVGSAAVLLRQAAGSQGPAASRPETLKAILLTGATKEEFPNWLHTPAVPLDGVLGAGELHIGNSWDILAGQEQASNLTAPRPETAWSSVVLTPGTTADYILKIPPGSYSETLTATACWNRIVRDTDPGTSFLIAVDPLADYNLDLSRVPPGGSPLLLEKSVSTSDNLEHLYRRRIPSGTYRLRLSLVSGADVPAALAWRIRTLPHRPAITLTRSGGQDQLEFSGLLTDQPYLIQSSSDLLTWTNGPAFTASGPVHIHNTGSTPDRRFYRLAATD